MQEKMKTELPEIAKTFGLKFNAWRNNHPPPSETLIQAADAFKSTTKPHLCSRNRQKKTASPAHHRESTTKVT